MNLEILQLTIRLLSAIFIGVGLLYTAKQIKLLIKSHSDNHEWNRRKVAQDASLMYSQLTEGNNLLNEHFSYVTSSEPVAMKTMDEKFGNEPELKPQLHRLLNYFNSLCRGVNHKLYDEKIIKSSWGGVIMRTYDQFKPYILWYQKNVSEEAWFEMERLANQWKHKSSASKVTPRKATGLYKD